VDQAAIAVVGDAGQGSGQESFGADESFVAGRQGVVGDQHGPQVSGDVGRGCSSSAWWVRFTAPDAIWVSRAAPAVLRSQFSADRWR
jgi:hypothetical protein